MRDFYDLFTLSANVLSALEKKKKVPRSLEEPITVTWRVVQDAGTVTTTTSESKEENSYAKNLLQAEGRRKRHTRRPWRPSTLRSDGRQRDIRDGCTVSIIIRRACVSTMRVSSIFVPVEFCSFGTSSARDACVRKRASRARANESY